MYDYLIYDRLKKYSKAGKDFHIPGHKANKEFLSRFPVADIDVTELPYSDNLSAPREVIADAQRDIAEILGAHRSYILTDGSSCGVLAMLYVASKRGTKIIVPRNCHQSVWNACKLFGLEPLIVQGVTRHGVIEPPEPDTIARLVVNDINISGFIVTSPDYYGNIAPLAEYAAILNKNKRLLMVDGAHGAHLAFGESTGGYAGSYADIWVDGAHKTLPTLTQGAILNVKNPELVADAEEGLSIFRTTSPSYPVMASVEYGVKLLANEPEHIARAKEAADTIRRDKNIFTYPSADWTKIAVDCEPFNISADEAAKALQNKGIYCEFSDGRYILFYLSPMSDAGEVKKLKGALKSVLSDKKLIGTYKARAGIPPAARTYSFQYALKRPSEWIPIDDAAGRMCAGNAGFIPPCIPVCVVGEMITESAVKALGSGDGVYGIVDGKIKVVKK